jgi:hypothetical protein
MDIHQAQDMPQVRVMPSDQLSEPLDPIAEAITQMDTIPLPKIESGEKVNWHFVTCTLVMFFAAFGVSLWYALTYPMVTVNVVPVEKSLSLTVPLHVSLRYLAPLTLTESLSVKTTGKGHQDARPASGTLTFYNGEFMPETIAAGAVFTGTDGIQVATDRSVTIPAANPPYFGRASVTAHAVTVGATGNIREGDINNVCCFLPVKVKNVAPFTGGADERDYRAVAKVDVDALAFELKQTLSKQIAAAFVLRPGEALQPTHCVFSVSSTRRIGEKADTVTVTVAHTCQGVAYNQQELTQKVTDVFKAQENPGPHYILVGAVQVSVISVSPFVVRCRGLWAFHLTESYLHDLATRIAGDTPNQAKAYLLHTGVIIQATVTQDLPKDPDYIRFQVFVGL